MGTPLSRCVLWFLEHLLQFLKCKWYHRCSWLAVAIRPFFARHACHGPCIPSICCICFTNQYTMATRKARLNVVREHVLLSVLSGSGGFSDLKHCSVLFLGKPEVFFTCEPINHFGPFCCWECIPYSQRAAQQAILATLKFSARSPLVIAAAVTYKTGTGGGLLHKPGKHRKGL